MMKEKITGYSGSYIKNMFRIISIASAIICIAVIITAILGYTNTKESLINKAKSQDIVFIVKSMSAKIDSRISRAIETSYIFARDPLNIEWVKGEEQDKEYGEIIQNKMDSIANSYDYNNFFTAVIKSKHYYRANSKKNDNGENYIVLQEDNPEDKWFWSVLKSKKTIDFNIGYDSVTKNTFLFVNTIMGSVDNPVGITGVGMNINEITKEFKEFKVGKESNLWIIDDKGIIQLSDNVEDIGKKYSEFVPESVVNNIENNSTDAKQEVKVSQYSKENNKIVDYSYCKLSSGDWTLFYEIPRTESISLLNSLRNNTIINVILVLAFFMILFYFISKKIANPYEQAILMNKELENKVNIRTQELRESNQRINDSIEYAKRLQESILPSKEELKKLFMENFVIWKPKDTVGGDFFWLREIEDVLVFVVGDCTGHGVPGAFMTMTVNAILHNIVNTINKEDPSMILQELHIQLRQALNKNSNPSSVDDGLDIAIFSIKKKASIIYAGANIELYIKREGEVKVFKPQTRGIGYRDIELKENLKNEIIQIQEGDIFIVTTDGFIHQNGGERKYPFGKKRLCNMIKECEFKDFESIKSKFENTMEVYKGNEEQRDDITVLGFKMK
ncbi:SpoIIE family protein phosphatase [Clostridium beijerinckii]|uniref:Serine phosphatase RsbU (Regulator of sigma subunit) n=4 Tax=Clostridium beijerinckii TaxID=1520 RepID=A0A9Q5GNQ4_CLOBE|nr:SpoIIE family protein phosphatase [Clostridium beijerinckii]MBA2887184.1 serine phosphatase RsbU (regulator of sigma subunit) [Clostridium beijerinckii]MBA2902075.1 serine phosphatase RsbU (regulator of sigma subunit) [Clostridium beijerinckii]MBA2911898.1 serine phosphatase RsbU (regulator of sigma subunit) [Clostridium beijerinckii]MBA9013766.1 serine phosphatase RsbU (regulator of sigma subunit) [Clostridium beijerinckii]NRS98096.1 serine phosphatase RsbU (regulator of sigma subunit) [Cl